MAILIELTDSLMSKILIGLPVKSLMQCICVCKSWYNLVSDPYFIRSHLIQKSADENEYLALGFTRFTVLSMNPYMEDYYSFRCDKTFLEKLKLKSQSPPTTQGFEIAGCCNGLLLMLSVNTYDSNMYLWNPSLGKSKRLPGVHDTYGNKFCLDAAGLVFLPEVCDYKVIRILKFLYEVSSVAEIYSLRSDSWRRIETPVMWFMPSYCKSPFLGVFVNSSFCWVGLKYQDKCWTNFIVSFDMKSETFKAIDFPVACLDYGSQKGYLAVFQESLYLFAFRFREGWSLWMMNEDCSSEMYWLKVCTFQYSQKLSPIGFMKNGDVIMEDSENKVSLHDPRNMSSPRNTECEIRGGIRSSGVYNYSPSLALLDERTGGLWSNYTVMST